VLEEVVLEEPCIVEGEKKKGAVQREEDP